MQGNVWGAVRNAYAAGILYGGYPFAPNVKYVGANCPTGVQRYDTLAAMFTSLHDGELCLIGPGEYDEGNLVISANNITVIGAGNRGDVSIAPSGAGYEGLQITGDDCTLVNVGVAGDDTSSYALNINAASRFRAYQCKFEGVTGANPACAVLLDGTADGQVGDALFDDCEFCWCSNAILFDDSSYGYPTQIRIKNCLFHNYTVVGLGIVAGGLVKDLWLENNLFGLQEDGSAPTDFILLSSNSNTGTITKNSFASATNATGTITIGTGLKYPTNYTEAGPSAARPA